MEEAPSPSPSPSPSPFYLFGPLTPIILASILTILCLCAFTLLVLLDIKKAFRKGANWLPGNALLLTALTIQALSFITGTNIRLSLDLQDEHLNKMIHLTESEDDFDEVSYSKELGDYLTQVIIVDAGTLNIIVFMGYFLPAMLAPRSINNLAATAALAIGIFFPVKNLFSKDKKSAVLFSKHKEISLDLFSEGIPVLCIIFLIVLLGCTVLAGKTVRRIMSQRISTILAAEDFGALPKESHHTSDAVMNWDGFQNDLFKSWIVARASQPDYVIARSVLSSAAGVVVSGCFIFSVVQYIYMFIILKDSDISFSLSATSLPFFVLLGFVLVGWMVICCRWFLAHLYFPWHREKFTWRRCIGIEDFWTRSLVDMIHKYDVKDWQSGYTDQRSCFSYRGIVTKLRLHKLLHLLRLLPMLILLISKICWLLSEIVLGMPIRFCLLSSKMVHKFMRSKMVHKFMRSRLKHADRLQEVPSTPSPTIARYVYKDYSKAIEPFCMPGEDPMDLWKANKNAINRITFLFNKGCKNGSDYTNTDSMFSKFSMEWVDQGSQLLDRLRKVSLPQVVRYFPSLDKQCWKMTAVSFIAIIFELPKVKKLARVTNAVEACSQAWDFLMFADSIDCHPQGKASMDVLDTDTDEVSMAADREFFRLQELYEKLPRAAQESSQDRTIDYSRNSSEALKVLLEREKEVTEKMVGNGNMNGDSKDCMKIAPSYNLYKLYTVLMEEELEIEKGQGLMEEELDIEKGQDLMEEELDIEKGHDLVVWAERSLRNVIACCLSKMPDMLTKHCRKCAEGFDEDNIWKAVYLAGKARGMLESWGLQVTTTTTTRAPEPQLLLSNGMDGPTSTGKARGI